MAGNSSTNSFFGYPSAANKSLDASGGSVIERQKVKGKRKKNSRRRVNSAVIRAEMTVAVENPTPDIFEGCGNGTLHTYVVSVPENWNADAGDRHIPVCLNE